MMARCLTLTLKRPKLLKLEAHALIGGLLTKEDHVMNNYALAKFRLAELFRLYWNSFLTVDYFAEYHGIPKSHAYRLINAGRKAHNLQAG